MQLVLISGLSGSGKSIALNVLEDCGHYCVDNLPAGLLPDLAGFLRGAGYQRVAVSIDVRSGKTLVQLPAHMEALRAQGVDLRLLFLSAKTDTLVKRFSETRRKHPLSDGNLTLPECIARERELLQELVPLANHIDTSDLAPNALRGWVKDFVQLARSGLVLLFQSFGFKHGIPLDADMVFDVRCLPNPHYDPVMRPLTGRDDQVIAFLDGIGDAQRMLEDIRDYVARWLPCFVRDNRSYLTVSLGCTGGRHRSVYFVEKLARHFRPLHGQVLVRHRELP